jgi:hypothetical protein
MDNTLLYVMTAFVVIAGISLLLQLAMIFGIYRTAKSTEQKVTVLMPKLESLLGSSQHLVGVSQKIVEDNRQQIRDIVAKAHEILDTTRHELAIVEGVLTDASARAKVQLDRAEMVIDDTMTRAHQTVASVHNGITRPFREVNGIAVGLKTAIAHLAKGNRSTPPQVTHDDEMFI